MRPNRRATPSIADFMTISPCEADADLSLADARERMHINNIRHLVVTTGGEVSGVVSSRDIDVVMGVGKVDASKLTVSEAMSKNPYTCAPNTPVDEVAQEMEAHRYGCAIIMSSGKPVGVFTTTDALRAIRQMASGRRTVDAETSSTHIVEKPAEREKVAHTVRTSDAVTRGGAGPSAGDGMGFDPTKI